MPIDTQTYSENSSFFYPPFLLLFVSLLCGHSVAGDRRLCGFGALNLLEELKSSLILSQANPCLFCCNTDCDVQLYVATSSCSPNPVSYFIVTMAHTTLHGCKFTYLCFFLSVHSNSFKKKKKKGKIIYVCLCVCWKKNDHYWANKLHTAALMILPIDLKRSTG